MLENYQLRFMMVGENPVAVSTKKYDILSHYLMYWDNPIDIVTCLIPLVNRGVKFGTDCRWKSYEEVPGLKEKMFRQWDTNNIPNPMSRWEKIKIWKGYYIEEEGAFLESIGADVVGTAFVTENVTVLSGSNLHFDDMELPSSEFKEIIIQWLCFILKNKIILPL